MTNAMVVQNKMELEGWTVDDIILMGEEVWQEHVDRIAYALEDMRHSQWALGDLLVHGVDRSLAAWDAGQSPIADRKMVRHMYLAKIAGFLHEDYGMLDDHERVARRWGIHDRFPDLSWGFYQRAVPGIDDELLERARVEGWTVSDFKAEKYPRTKTAFAIIGSICSQLLKLTNREDDPDILPVLERAIEVLDELEEIKEQLRESGGYA